jgi:hypothetical protein
MVAVGNNPTPLTLSPLVTRMGYGPVRFTFKEALRMVEQGLLPEDACVELLDGALISVETTPSCVCGAAPRR